MALGVNGPKVIVHPLRQAALGTNRMLFAIAYLLVERRGAHKRAIGVVGDCFAVEIMLAIIHQLSPYR